MHELTDSNEIYSCSFVVCSLYNYNFPSNVYMKFGCMYYIYIYIYIYICLCECLDYNNK